MSISNKIRMWFSTVSVVQWGIMAIVYFIILSTCVFFWLGVESLFISGALILLGVLSFFGAIITSLVFFLCMFWKIREWGLQSAKEKKARLIVFVILACLNAFFLLGGGFVRIQSTAMRTYVAMTGGVKQLQGWAMSILEMEPEDAFHDPESKTSMLLKEDAYSEQVKKMRPAHVFMRYRNGSKYLVIRIVGGGFIESDIGIVVYSEPNLADTSNATLIKWSEGVYAYFGRAP